MAIHFNIRLIKQGDKYGRNDALTHDDPRPMIEFYDVRYPHTPLGQFIARYYLDNLADHSGGLKFCDYESDWSIDAKQLQNILSSVSGM